jgi:hypothetical protein
MGGFGGTSRFGGMRNRGDLGADRSDFDENAPSPMQEEKREARQALYPGTTRQRSDKFLADVKKWAGADHAIYLVGTETEVRRMLSDSVPSKQIEIVKRVSLPPMSVARMGGGMGGFGMGGMGGGMGMGGPGFRRGGGGAVMGGGPRFGGPGMGGMGGMGGGPGTGGPGGGGGGPMGGDWLGDAKEIVIARYTPVSS